MGLQIGVGLLSPVLVLAALFLVVGAGLCYSGLVTLFTSSRRDHFEPVEAEIRSSSLEEKGSHGPGPWVPDVVYEYAVDGETYVSDDVYPGGMRGSSDRQRHQAVVEKYPAGETAEAYYDPEDPSESFLEDQSTADAGQYRVVAGVVCLLVGVGIVVAVATPLL